MPSERVPAAAAADRRRAAAVDEREHDTTRAECAALARHGAWRNGKPAKRSRRPRLFFSGAVITKGHGPELYEASRVPLYRCWKNASRELGFQIVQTEHVDVSVYPWEVERGVDANAVSRQASVCVVPEGKSGGYGHRATTAAMLGRAAHCIFERAIPAIMLARAISSRW